MDINVSNLSQISEIQILLPFIHGKQHLVLENSTKLKLGIGLNN